MDRFLTTVDSALRTVFAPVSYTHLDVYKRQAHWVMREAIEQYVSREEKREAFRQDTLKSWDVFQETGLHVGADDVDAWLSSWGTENELPAPVCHK